MLFGFSEYSEEGRPWFHIGQVAVTSTVLLVGGFTLSMIVVTLLRAAQFDGVVSAMILEARPFWRGQVWRLVTWPLLNFPSVWFALSMLMLYFFGREVERVLGKRGLLKLVGWVAGALAAITILLPGGGLASSGLIGFGVFIAFAIMQPGAAMLFGLTAKWVAIILIAIHALSALANRDLVSLIQLATLCAATAITLKYMGAAYGLPWLRLPVVRFKLRSARPAPPKALPATRAESRSLASPDPEIDRLLDKVAAQGLHSLTDAERRTLDDASHRYQRRK